MMTKMRMLHTATDRSFCGRLARGKVIFKDSEGFGTSDESNYDDQELEDMSIIDESGHAGAGRSLITTTTADVTSLGPKVEEMS